MFRSRKIGFLLVVLGSLLAAGLHAQTFTATLSGRVIDPSGGAVVGAKVTIHNVGTNQEQTVTIAGDGNFVLPLLPPGEYSLSVEATGFKREVRSGITLQVGQQVGIEIKLSLGNVSEVIQVSEDVPLVQSENASLGNVVDQKKIVELPLNGRDYLQLAQLQPNVFAPAQGSTLGFRGGINIAGNSEVANNYTMDGIDNNDETTNQPLHRPILDAVREFKVVTGTYAAEYGRQAGGQIIVTTKSGTNQFHGSAFEFYRDSIFDASNFFAPAKPTFRRNQFGGVIGGPIRHDRTFFFAGYEGQRRGQQEASLANVPTEAMKLGDFSALLTNQVIRTDALGRPIYKGQIFDPSTRRTVGGKPVMDPFPNNKIDLTKFGSPQGIGLLALYPNPNLTGANNFVSAAASPLRLDQFSVRVDHRFNDKSNMFGAYEFADSNEFFALANPLCSARSVPGWGCNELQRTQTAAIIWTYTLSAHLINEARIGYTRFGFFRLQQDRNADVVKRLNIGGLTDAGDPAHPFNNGAPQLTLSGFDTIGGPTNLPQGRHDNTYHYVDNMTYIRGSHTMKFGFDIRRFLFNSFFTSFGRGAFSFTGRSTGQPELVAINDTQTGNSVADLLLGLPRQADRNLGEPFHNAMTFSSGYYFQDDWKVSPRLTLNLGLRYELNLPPVEKVNKMASFDPTPGTIKVSGGSEAYIDPVTKKLLLRPRPDVGRRLWKTDKNNFGPRIGLAWRPFGNKTVIRAGFGTFYNYQIVGNGITPLSRNSPFRQRQTAGPISAAGVSNIRLASAFSGNPAVVAPGIDPNFVTAYLNQWSLGVQHEIAKDTLLDVAYLGSEAHKLPIGVNINQAMLGAGPIRDRRPFPDFGNITGGYISSVGNSTYNGLQVRLERRLSGGLSFLSSYNWSKSIDQNFGISEGGDSSDFFAQDARNLKAERGPSDYDTRHRWVFSYVYDLPFGKGRRFSNANRVINALIGGWQTTGILTLQTARPFTVTMGRDASNTGGGSDRPNLIGEWRISNPTPNRWFNTCTIDPQGVLANCAAGEKPAWAIPAPGTFGNAGRNILRGDGLKNFDLGLFRSFRITERQGLQFRAELFNLANHPNLYFPEARIDQGRRLGSITRAAFQSQTGAQRQMQLAVKYIF
ncbi:MAG TPA: TonB-dependent receptor [Candidatus Dormibacteraeota bacterium]|nr:TonB-dependent receptor [Candidatus Dormibacteraeota bacterium]